MVDSIIAVALSFADCRKDDIMRTSQKVSARQSSIKQGRGGGAIRRRPSHPYGAAFFVALFISIVGVIGFLGVLAVAIAGG